MPSAISVLAYLGPWAPGAICPLSSAPRQKTTLCGQKSHSRAVQVGWLGPPDQYYEGTLPVAAVNAPPAGKSESTLCMLGPPSHELQETDRGIADCGGGRNPLGGERGRRKVPLPNPFFLSEADITRHLGTVKGAPSVISAASDRPLGRKAAVLVPMFQSDEGWHLLLTERSQAVAEHAGQVSFPGGQSQGPSEETIETALRETEEEIGLPPDRVRVLGHLDPLETVTGFLVTPVVGVVPWPTLLRPSPIEVREIFHVPLRWLGQTKNLRWQPHPPSTKATQEWVPVYQPFEGHVIWGATARIIVALLSVLGVNLMPQVK